MAKMEDIKIKFELEPLVKLACAAPRCRYHTKGYCALKYVLINEAGECAGKELMDLKEDSA